MRDPEGEWPFAGEADFPGIASERHDLVDAGRAAAVRVAKMDEQDCTERRHWEIRSQCMA